MNINSFMKAYTEVPALIKGKTKCNLDGIITSYPDGVTIAGVHKSQGKNGEYVIFTIKQNPAIYTTGGRRFTDTVLAMIQQYGSEDAINDALQDEDLKIRFYKREYAEGKFVTDYEYIPE